MAFNGFVLAGTHSGAGKTTITAGILGALKARGLRVQPYKTGPDYIDPAFHNFVVGGKSKNLDTWMLPEEAVCHLFAKSAEEADVVVVEGVMGLFDGLGAVEDQGSTSALAKLLGLPVILIVDGSGMARSSAAIVKGYSQFDPDCKIAGVILNRVGSQGHYDIMKEAIETYTGIPCIGYVSKNAQVSLGSRHLGLVPAGEVEDLEEKLNTVVSLIESSIDLEALLKLTQIEKPTLLPYDKIEALGHCKGLRVGVALDQSFNFYYEDNLSLMASLGAELVYFSPMADEKLPDDLDLVYIGGGFPEVFAKTLSENLSFIESLRAYQAKGKPIYAECGGYMYLTEAITDLEGKRYPMTAILKGETKMTKGLKHFGYAQVVTGQGLTEEPITFRAHEFHRSEYVGPIQHDYYQLYKYKGTEKERTWHCGSRAGNCFGAYAHVHFYSEPLWLAYWLSLAKKTKEAAYEGI